ncbi:MAG: hypothetical protein AMJ53_05210, partial [Gammaproteobacteria bacterium SG8_11]
PDGQRNAYFVAHGMEGITGTTSLTATAPGFNSATVTVNVVQPALRIDGLTVVTTTLSADDPFEVRVGLPNSSNTTLSESQRVRAGSSLTATITSSDVAVGVLVTTAATGSPVTVEIPSGGYRSHGTVAAGGVAFDPQTTSGNTTVSSSIPGFIATDAASVVMDVTAPGISFYYGNHTVGAGLMSRYDNLLVQLGATEHGGVTVRIQSSDPSLALVSPNGDTVGTEFIDVFVPDGERNAYFIVHGMEGVTGTATLTASEYRMRATPS